MKTAIPVVEKTPLALDPSPLTGSLTARAGAALTTRIVPSMNLAAPCDANLLLSAPPTQRQPS